MTELESTLCINSKRIKSYHNGAMNVTVKLSRFGIKWSVGFNR